jgi:translation initiation factor IF-2
LLSELQSEEVPPQEPVVDIVKETPTSILTQMLQQREAVKEGVEQKVLHVVVKASSQGTLEAVKHELKKLGDDERIVNILESATGEVTEGDIRRAKAAGGIVISFQQPLSAQTQKTAKQERVIVRNYGIIYEMMDELGTALDSLIEPPEVEVEIARAKIKKIFELTNGSIVAGSEVIKGTMVKGYNIYVERPRESTATEISEVARGKIKSLKLAKTEAREIKKGQDCGILIDPTPEGLEEGDEIVAFKLEK